jgi:phosphohistidine phosphatase SixA
MVRGLLPEDPAEMMGIQLESETRDIMLVGHMPNIAALAARLAGAADAAFPQHGAICFERVGGGWKERWRLHPRT